MTELEQAAGRSPDQGPPRKPPFYALYAGAALLEAALFTSFLGLAATGLPLRFSRASGHAVCQSLGGFGAILFFHNSARWC